MKSITMIIQKSTRERYAKLPKKIKKKLAVCQLLALDFDGVFTDNTVYVNEKGEEMVRCNRSDTFGLKELLSTGTQVMIISTEENPVVRKRAEKLKLPCVYGLSDKALALRNETEKRGLSLQSVIYVGNDVNDIGCFEIAGLKIAVADAYPPVAKIADYVTQASGGNGAVREVLTLLLLAKE